MYPTIHWGVHRTLPFDSAGDANIAIQGLAKKSRHIAHFFFAGYCTEFSQSCCVHQAGADIPSQHKYFCIPLTTVVYHVPVFYFKAFVYLAARCEM